MPNAPRPRLPSGVARQLRKEAGFGCCQCGTPIIQYHHIVGWSEEQHFRPEDMMALCPTCHDQATKGALPVARQRALKARPFNLAANLVFGRLHTSASYCAVDLGTVTMVSDGPLIAIDGEPLLQLRLQDGSLLLSARVYSSTGELLAEIADNEWVSGTSVAWDIISDWQKLEVRERKGSISIALDLIHTPPRLKGNLYGQEGSLVAITDTGIRVNHKGLGIADLALVNMILDVKKGPVSLNPARSDFGFFISWPNPRERLWKAKEAFLRTRPKDQP